jgi:hypothetical protein
MRDVRPRINEETWKKPYIAAWPGDWLLEALGYGPNESGTKKPRTRKKAAPSSDAKVDGEASANTGAGLNVTSAPSTDSTIATETAGGDDLIREGHRNLTLTSMAGHMRKAGFDEAAILAALAVVSATRCIPPMSAEEVEVIARSVARYEPDPFAHIIFKGVAPRGASSSTSSSNTTTDGIGTRDTTTDGTGSNTTGGTAAESNTMQIDRIPASKLLALDPDAQWLWRGYMAKGGITLFSAYWKAGKTVLLSHLLKALGSGVTFCDQEVVPSRVVYVTEESQSLWAGRRDKLGLGDWCEFVVRPFKQRPSTDDWCRFLNGLVESLKERPADLVVFDPLTHLWPVRDENSAAEVGAALMPLRVLNEETGCNLTLVHHLRKSDGTQATGSRGSGALAAFVDTILELRRYQDGGGDRRRVLTAHGRYDDTPEESVVELSEDGTSYSASGTKTQSKLEDAIATLMTVLTTTAPGITKKEILKKWPEDDAVGSSTLTTALNHGIKVGFWERSGDGEKSSPYRYYRTPKPA